MTCHVGRNWGWKTRRIANCAIRSSAENRGCEPICENRGVIDHDDLLAGVCDAAELRVLDHGRLTPGLVAAPGDGIGQPSSDRACRQLLTDPDRIIAKWDPDFSGALLLEFGGYKGSEHLV